ncbi:MAG: hypothetical protein N2652_03505 [Kiritimatiellae bacterium]|nr:hypothetical protein [Kiritimatiellia bacterium]
MRRPVEWVERNAEGVRVRIRVVFHGTRSISWQFRRDGDERWTRQMQPTAEQWEFLLRKVEDRYRRRAASWEDVLRTRAWRRAAEGPPPTD